MEQLTFFEQSTIWSPLSYFGSKRQMVKRPDILDPYLDRFLRNQEIVSPFLGSASLELFFASRNVLIYGSDNFYYLVNFWEQIQMRPQVLVDRVKAWYPCAVNQENLFDLISEISEPIDQAAIFWIINKWSWSAMTLAGVNPKNKPIEVGLPTFTKYSGFKSPNLFVDLLDYREALDRHPSMSAYLDPPYYGREDCYGNGSGTFDHNELHEILSDRDSDFILSYNDVPDIKDMYSDFNVNVIDWRIHSTSHGSDVKTELLITNF